MTSLGITRGASLWYPIMLTQACQEISESKAAEMLGMNILEYRDKRQAAIDAVMRLIEELPSPLCSLVEAMAKKPDLFDERPIK